VAISWHTDRIRTKKMKWTESTFVPACLQWDRNTRAEFSQVIMGEFVIVEWFGLEGTFKDHPVQPPTRGRDIFH